MTSGTNASPSVDLLSLQTALEELGWLKSSQRVCPSTPIRLPENRCILRWLLTLDSPAKLTPAGASKIQRWIKVGMSLRRQFRNSRAGTDDFLGARFYWSHARCFTTRTTSLVCSRSGRDGRNLPDWPLWLDSALGHIRLRGSSILKVSGTAAEQLFSPALPAAQFATLHVLVADSRSGTHTPATWLVEQLNELHISEQAESTLCVSPELIGMAANQKTVAKSIEHLALRDRIAIGLADEVFAVSVRAGGAIEQLLRQRITSRNIPKGSTFVAVRSGEKQSARRSTQELITAGGVGWYLSVLPRSNSAQRGPGCIPSVTTHSDAQAIRSSPLGLTFAMPGWWCSVETADWPYVAHCTRASSGPRPGESMQSSRQRTWVQGTAESRPFATLCNILDSKRLTGGQQLTRGAHRRVSFSAVPLPQLLSRRNFQSHLGRWDWEPYGILLSRQALQRLGGQPVVYGDEATYRSLPTETKPFFQPTGSISNAASQPKDWSAEQEWRLLGDLRFSDLEPHELMVFTAFPSEAFTLSRHFGVPAVWTHVATS